MSNITTRLQAVKERLRTSCQMANRSDDSVRLLAVSKTFDAAAICSAAAAGQVDFGENYIQEALQKIGQLHQLPLVWHCIGPIQGNKTRLVAEHFSWVHTIDRLRIAQRLSQQRPAQLAPLQVCIQVNIDAAASKSGVTPSEVLALAQAVAQLPRLRLRGLMCIPQPAPDFAAACTVFGQAKALFDSLNAAGFALDTLSMGMSDDLEAAIASGSTMVRVGAAIFGRRSQTN